MNQQEAIKLTKKQTADLLDLLWDYMKTDPEHSDRVRTGWGTKTQAGLVASVEHIFNKPGNDPYLKPEEA